MEAVSRLETAPESAAAGPPCVAVVDDDPAAGTILSQWIRAADPAAPVAIYGSAEAILLDNRYFDIVFMDIRLAGTDGIEAVRRLKQRSPGTVFIFVSAFREYVFEALDVHPFHFLPKPLEREQVLRVFREAAVAVHEQRRRGGERLIVENRARTVSLPLRDISRIERSGRRLEVHTASQVHETYGSLDEMAHRAGRSFYRCHRSVLVNMAWIASYTRDEIFLADGSPVSLARKKYADFVRQYMWYLHEYV